MFVIESCKYWYEKEGGKCIEKTISQKKKNVSMSEGIAKLLTCQSGIQDLLKTKVPSLLLSISNPYA